MNKRDIAKEYLHKPLSNRVSYPLLLLAAAVILIAVNNCLLGNTSDPVPGYAISDAELVLSPSEVAVEIGETVTLDLILHTNAHEVVAIDVSIDTDDGLVITAIEPNYTQFATFAPIDSENAFDEELAISTHQFGAVSYDLENGEIIPGVEGNGLLVATITFRADVPGSLYASIDLGSGEESGSNVFISNFLSSTDVLDTTPVSALILSDCTPDCTGKNCGSDGCLGTCGTCATDEYCLNGTCRVKSIKEEDDRRLF